MQKYRRIRGIVAAGVVAIVALGATVGVQSQTMVNGVGLLADFLPVEPLTALNSSGDEFGVCYDSITGSLLYTSTLSGTSAVYGITLNALDAAPGKPLPGDFNNSSNHRACVSIGKNGEGVGVAFVSGAAQANPAIFTVLRDDGHFNLGHVIEELTCDCFTSFPTLSPDGLRLVFSSNRTGGNGGMDLWVSDRRVGTEWTQPALLSSSLNSTADEISPVFISSDSLLYASNGYGGRGGFDIYITVLREGVWQEPEPLTWLNSEFDDSDCILLPNGNIVFASNRPGGKGGFDLWIARIRN